MAKVQLNDKAARRPLPKGGREDVWDTILPGFGLRVSASGSRVFMVMGRLNGRQVRRTLGRYPAPHVTHGDPLGTDELWVPEAREKARQWLADLARGIDPAPVEREPEAAPAAQAAALHTFGQVAAGYLADPSKRGGGSLRSRAELERKVRVDLAAWNDRPIAEITRADVRALINAKHAKSPVSANRLLSLVHRVMRWAVRDDLIPHNPAADIDKPADETERDRVLSLGELAQVWKASDALGYPYGDLIKMLMLTAQRRGEVAGLSRSELLGNAWRLPDSRAKRKKGHLVPLSPRAVAIIEGLPRIGDSDLLFTTGKRAAKKGEKVDPKAPPAPISGWSRVKDRLDRIIAEQAAKAADEPLDLARHSLAAWTLHDIRRSVGTHLRDSDVMGAARVDRLTVSQVLNHAESGVTKLYDRYSADPEKRQALEAWATVVERVCGLNVIPLDQQRARA